jgi:amino acid adenylation domain-containing protein
MLETPLVPHRLAADRAADLPVAVQAALAGDYGFSEVSLSLVGEGVHTTYSVAGAAAGDRYVARVYGAGIDGTATVEGELAWLEGLRRDAGLRVPEPVATPCGRRVVSLPRPGGGRQLALFRWLPGARLRWPLDATTCLRCGELMARIHRHSERFTLPPGLVRPRYDLDRLLGQPAAPGARPVDAGRAAAAAWVREQLSSLGENRESFGLIHGDLQVTNFLLQDGQLAALDFADCGWGFYLYDIAAALLPLWRQPELPALTDAFLRGYRRVRPLPAAQEAYLEPFLVARALFVLRWSEENWHLPAVRATGEPILARLTAQLAIWSPGAGAGGKGPAATGAGTAGAGEEIPALLSRLCELRVRLWEEEGRLCFKAPPGVVTPALRGELAAHKAELLEFLRAAAEAPEPPPLLPIGRDHELPLSFAQQRLWVLDLLESGTAAYNLAQAIHLQGPLRPALLQRSLQEVVRRHEVLRTTFTLPRSEAGPPPSGVAQLPVQRIAAPSPLALPAVDLRALPEGVRAGEWRRLAREEAARPFHLERGPLVRFTLLALAAGQHMLLTSLHHIVADGWSSGLLLREITALYEAFAAGRPSPLPELPIQYADFSVWQRNWLQGPVLAALLAYWRQRLAGAPDRLELASDRPRPPLQSYRGGRIDVQLPRATSEALAALARREGGTLFMALVTVFTSLLQRHSGQDDILIGSPIANRTRAEIEPLIGFFVNTLVLRATFVPALTGRGLLDQVRQTTIAAYQHQDLPFEKLVEELQPRRDASHTPLFQVLLTFQNSPVAALPARDLTLRLASPQKTAVAFDLDLTLQDGVEGIWGVLGFARDLFDKATAYRLVEHFERLAAETAADPDRRLEDLPLLSAAERQALLVEWNDTAVDFDLQPSVFALFAAQAARTPAAPAVACDGEVWAYGDLRQRAGQLAHRLRRSGVGRAGGPDVVALLAERGPELVAAILAVLAAGAAFLPLDPSHPPARLAAVLGGSACRLMVVAEAQQAAVQEALAALPEGARPEVLALGAGLDGEPGEEDPEWPAAPSDGLAYVIYTSGSTGVPKGAMLDRRGLINHFLVLIELLGLTARDVIAQTAAQCFDVSVWQMLTPLLVGARVEVCRDETVRDPERLLAAMVAARVSLLQTVPALIAQLLEVVARQPEHRRALAQLRWMSPGGETLPPALCRRWQSEFPEVPLLNFYGPAECSDDVTFEVIRNGSASAAVMPIGRPIANHRVYVLDRAGWPVPLGVPGELGVAGIGVGWGYRCDAARTAQVFIPDAWAAPAAGAGTRLYRTGDLVRFRTDGKLEFLGRIDHQVKIRGFRIELGEVEAALALHPAVQAAVAMAHAPAADRGQDSGGPRLVAYLVTAPGEAPSVAELRRFLADRLPGYMVPSAFVPLTALPLSPSGKVNRAALAALAPAGALDAGNAFVAPRTALEREVAAIWSEVLRCERVGVHDNFFVLGGHSLFATTLISRVRDTFEVEISLATFFKGATVADLAENIAATRRVVAELRRVQAGRAQPASTALGRGGEGEREEGEL